MNLMKSFVVLFGTNGMGFYFDKRAFYAKTHHAIMGYMNSSANQDRCRIDCFEQTFSYKKYINIPYVKYL